MDQPGLKKMKTLKGFLREEFGTEDVLQVNPGELKEKIEGEKMNKRSEYRKGFTNMLQGKLKLYIWGIFRFNFFFVTVFFLKLERYQENDPRLIKEVTRNLNPTLHRV